ncbi:phage terminase small subunit, partial [Escherichia coli]|uniref:phage terminase small subunit n=1 Tax=Escherichia coli TaxID=562 RepID=UPI001CC48800
MGSRGPVGKRKQELNGHRSKDELAGKTVSSVPGAVNVAIPEPDPGWHPIASALWRAASVSGQSAFYEPSDWAVLFSLMDDLSAYKRKAVRSGQML